MQRASAKFSGIFPLWLPRVLFVLASGVLGVAPLALTFNTRQYSIRH